MTDHLTPEALWSIPRVGTPEVVGDLVVTTVTTSRPERGKQTDRYRCAIAHAAVTDLPGMYASDITSGRQYAYGAEVWDDLDRVNRWSPAAHAAGYATPTLVIHGERDYRVPVTQGLEFHGVLQARGIDARLVYYPDENHWILSQGNSIHWYGEVVAWLERHIG